VGGSPDRKAYTQTTPDQKLKIFSKEYNSFIKAGQMADNSTNNRGRGRSNTLQIDGEMFRVSTQDPFNFNQFDTLVLIGMFFPQTFNDEQYAQPVLEVARYQEGKPGHVDAPIVVLQEPLFNVSEEGTPMALAKLGGHTFVNVTLTDVKHTGFKLVSDSAVLESCITGVVSNEADGGLSGTVAFGQILPDPSVQQFKVIAITEPDMVDCITYNDGVDGSVLIKVAMPWVIRRTPFDGVVDPNLLRNPLIRYEYFSNIERRAFVKEDAAAAEVEFDQIMNTPYYKNDIIEATKNVVGFGIEDVIDIAGNPVIWLDDNRSSRFWYQNLAFEEPVA